jgi:hypothetical protein
MREPKAKCIKPDTASAELSVWRDIDRAALDRQTQALEAKGHVAGRRCYQECPTSASDGLYPLPFVVEKGLADDLAFIAACQPHANFVSAVAIEQRSTPPSLVVKLAVNNGVSSEVEETFDRIFAVLREHARNGNISPKYRIGFM